MIIEMQNSFCSGASSNHMRTCSEIEVKCHHKIDSKLRIVKIGSNYGNKFYECSLWPISSQNFFFA